MTTWSTRAPERREEAAGAIPVHDLLRDPRTRAANTINHPGDPVLVGMARCVQRTLGWPETAVDPCYEMLAALRPDWVVDGRPVTDASIVAAQLAWHHERPDVVRFVLTLAAEQLGCLGVDRV